MILPNEIILETTNYCNLSCKYCHFHGPNAVCDREKGFITEKIWKKVIDEIGSWEKNCTLITHGAGEPMLYKDLDKLLVYAKKFKNLFVGFMTNGMLLDEDYIKFLFDIDLDWISFSIDGTDPELHGEYRKGSDLSKIESNLYNFIDMKKSKNRKNPLILLNMVVYPGFEHEKSKFIDKWINKVNKITLSKFRPLGSRKLWDENECNFAFKPCKLLENQMVISYDGNVGLCCEDIFLNVNLGNVLTNKVADIYNCEKIEDIRQAHNDGNLNNLILCSDCHAWGSDIILESKEYKSFYYEKTPAYEGYTTK